MQKQISFALSWPTHNLRGYSWQLQAPAGVDGVKVDRRVRIRGAPRLAGHGPMLFAGLAKYVDQESDTDVLSGATKQRHSSPDQ